MISTSDTENLDPPLSSGGLVLRPAHRLQKLRAMSVAELSARVAYRVRTHIERERHRRGHFARPDRLRRALNPQLQAADWRERLRERGRRTRPRFFALTDARERMQHLFRTAYAEELAEARVEADNVRNHRIAFFGRTFAFGRSIDWHADPVTGRQWPRVYHADVPVHGGDVGFGDVKYVWELNRHQFLIDLAKTYFLEGAEPYAAEVRALVTDWLDKNPYGTGVSWACALEPSFRALSWLWAYHLCLDDPALDAITHARWLSGFYDHGRFLRHHLETYSSPFNHLIGEAAALYMLGVLFPEFRDSSAWRARGRQILESRLEEQFYADGGSAEQSTFYHHATLGFYVLAVLLGRANGEEFARPLLQAVERAIEFSMALMQPDGRIPRIGGGDDGKPLRMQHLPFWDFRPFQAIGAVMFNRPDFKHAAGRFHEDALWVLGADGLERFSALGSEPPPTATPLTRSGYFVFRNGWTERSDYVCFDCGEQARGLRTDSVPSAAHGHADCLSVTIWLCGRPVLIDPGFFCYNGDPAWEVHFRKTVAHNTVRIDGRDQAHHIAKMAWCRTYRPVVDRWQTDAGGSFVTGWHDGYKQGERGGVLHRRTVWLRPGGYVLIADELTGDGAHLAEWTYQFAPGAAALNGDSGLTFDECAEMAWASTHHVAADLRQGGSRPDEGWIAPSLGVRVPAPRLTLRGEFTTGKMVVLSVLVNRTATKSAWRVLPYHGETSGCLALQVEGEDVRDLVIAGTASKAAVGGVFETDALVAVHRERPGGNPELHHVGGSYVRSSRPGAADGGAAPKTLPREPR
jgi:hypothetical protein